MKLGIALIAALALLAACRDSGTTNAAGAIVQDGQARFTVLTPTLIRLEYAADGSFEDRPTMTAIHRSLPVPAYSTAIENGVRVIRTSALTMRWSRDGAFTPQNLTLDIAGATASAHPQFGAADGAPGNLGGWRRSLDNDADAQALHDGLLSREGWYLLDDSATVLLTTAAPGYAVRPAHDGAYQDGYLFAYGHDYAQGLSDLRALTGAAPLLPRKAFGVWFSRYWAYSDTELRDLVAAFRAHGVPLDTLSLDTDWKLMHDAQGCAIFDAVAGARPGDPCSWNGWDWNRDLFPDPPAFLAWAHGQGLSIAANIHPSIDSTDPAYAGTQARAGNALATDQAQPSCQLFQADPFGQCYVFDWAQAPQLDAYFALHAPLAAQGIDFWWLDWCCDGASANAPGLTADTWINSRYAQDAVARGQRWGAFSRIGGSFQGGQGASGGAGVFAEHRYTLHFTGDTCGTWPMLAFEARFTAEEGNLGLPYVSHDIGSFLGPPTTTGCNGTLGHTSHLPDDLYVRWVAFGTFQPLLRLHSHHGDRLPWDYPGAAEAAATGFLRLRERLVPWLYTLARASYDSGLPLARALYLTWPGLEAAYQHPTQYSLGSDVLIAPVAAPGDPAQVSVWLPPGAWYDFFTGERFDGPATIARSVPLDRYPVFVRAGAILPLQPDLPTTAVTPPSALTLLAWPGNGSFELYDDEGQGFGYQAGAATRTPIATRADGACRDLSVAPARGSFPGAPTMRSWELRFLDADPPAAVTIDGVAQPAGAWSYDPATRSVIVAIGARSTSLGLRVVIGGEGCS